MKLIHNQTSIASYCQDFISGRIAVNPDYQRTDKVWPPKARSFLIDTIILGYPTPKLLLWQRTDLKTRETSHQVVDGQQRTRAIVDFFTGALALTTGTYSGSRYATLPEDAQTAFVNYTLSSDVFLDATEAEIRETFRRINSYTAPLNRQEQRHAQFQGEFKWYVYALTSTYSQVLKDFSVLSEKQISRMVDAELMTEISRAIVHGIETWSPAKLQDIYSENDKAFAQQGYLQNCTDRGFAELLALPELAGTPLMSRSMFYTLFLAFVNARMRPAALSTIYDYGDKTPLADRTTALANLMDLAGALGIPEPSGPVRNIRQRIARGYKHEDQKGGALSLVLQGTAAGAPSGLAFMQRYSRLGSLWRTADRRLKRLRRRAHGFAHAHPSTPTHQVEAECAAIVIDLQNSWGNLARSFYLSSALGTESRGGTRITSLSPPSVNDAIGIAIKARGRRGATPRASGEWHRHDEPAWFVPSVLIDCISAVGATNVPEVQRAFTYGFAVFGDLPVFRNYFAHRNLNTRYAAMNLAPKHGITTLVKPSVALATAPFGNSRSLLEEWAIEVHLTMDELCR